MDYKVAVFIGRFQPFHKGHLEIIKYGLTIADKVIVLVGSANSAPNIKNPFTYTEREAMINGSLPKDSYGKVEVLPLRDAYYTENNWVTDVQNKVRRFADEGDSVALLGNYKDSSSYYLRSFPQWDFTPVKNDFSLDATTIREALFGRSQVLPDVMPKNVEKFLANMIEQGSLGWTDFPSEKKDRFQKLLEEHTFIKDYKKKHAWHDSKIPYAPIFVTVDSVVISSGHVLVVRRKFEPGKGLLALPGGFVKQDEHIQAAALRELKEETGIKVDKIILESSISESKVFDHPHRSLRGRTITHAYCIRLKDGQLPDVKGSDDAEKALWIPLADIKDEEFYEDHAHIIRYFVSRN